MHIPSALGSGETELIETQSVDPLTVTTTVSVYVLNLLSYVLDSHGYKQIVLLMPLFLLY